MTATITYIGTATAEQMAMRAPTDRHSQLCNLMLGAAVDGTTTFRQARDELAGELERQGWMVPADVDLDEVLTECFEDIEDPSLGVSTDADEQILAWWLLEFENDNQ